jgi:hypothetical protein
MTDYHRAQDDATRQRIKDAINAANDDGQRAILMLLLDISEKIDVFLNDERRLREMVLNGSNATHDDDHKYIAQLRQQGGLLDQTATVIADRHKHGGYCDWAKAKQDDEKDSRIKKSALAWDYFGKVLWSVTLLIAGAIAATYLGGNP